MSKRKLSKELKNAAGNEAKRRNVANRPRTRSQTVFKCPFFDTFGAKCKEKCSLAKRTGRTMEEKFCDFKKGNKSTCDYKMRINEEYYHCNKCGLDVCMKCAEKNLDIDVSLNSKSNDQISKQTKSNKASKAGSDSINNSNRKTSKSNKRNGKKQKSKKTSKKTSKNKDKQPKQV